ETGKADPGAGPETSLTTDPVAKAGAVNLAARSTSIYSPTFSTKSALSGHWHSICLVSDAHSKRDDDHVVIAILDHFTPKDVHSRFALRARRSECPRERKRSPCEGRSRW
ncbi:MAG: hypothetical protein Q7V40_18720, partial [Pseudolabrys sp.]|nr:hypothetical protein [Pseudolabrys sp.]